MVKTSQRSIESTSSSPFAKSVLCPFNSSFSSFLEGSRQQRWVVNSHFPETAVVFPGSFGSENVWFMFMMVPQSQQGWGSQAGVRSQLLLCHCPPDCVPQAPFWLWQSH